MYLKVVDHPGHCGAERELREDGAGIPLDGVVDGRGRGPDALQFQVGVEVDGYEHHQRHKRGCPAARRATSAQQPPRAEGAKDGEADGEDRADPRRDTHTANREEPVVESTVAEPVQAPRQVEREQESGQIGQARRSERRHEPHHRQHERCDAGKEGAFRVLVGQQPSSVHHAPGVRPEVVRRRRAVERDGGGRAIAFDRLRREVRPGERRGERRREHQGRCNRNGQPTPRRARHQEQRAQDRGGIQGEEHTVVHG